MKSFFSATVFLVVFSGLFSDLAMSGDTLYKWVDDKGKTYFSDQMRPDDNKYKLEKLDKKAAVIEVIDLPKTPEEREKEKQLKVLRQEQEKLIADQKIHDKSLLSTYQSKDDLVIAQNRKKQTLERKTKTLEAELKIHIVELRKLQTSAAGFERNAKKIPEVVFKNIKNAEEEIEHTKTEINKSIADMKKANDEFEAEVKRYVMLTQGEQAAAAVVIKLPSIEEANSLGLFRCDNDEQCNQAWELASSFVNTFSTTAPDVITDKLIMSSPPTSDTDFSLSISKVVDAEKNDQLFLDIHCRDTSTGKELCASQKAQDLRSSFRPYVNERLRSKVPTP